MVIVAPYRSLARFSRGRKQKVIDNPPLSSPLTTNREWKCADTTGTVPVPWAGHFQYEYLSQINYTEAILSNSTRKLLWFKITKLLKFTVSFIIIFDTLSFPITGGDLSIGGDHGPINRTRRDTSFCWEGMGNIIIIYLHNIQKWTVKYSMCLTERLVLLSLMGLLQLRFEHDSATTRYEVFRALAYQIVYENQR